jgi:hypothetical protein
VFEAATRAFLVERVLAREDEPNEGEAKAFVALLLDGMGPKAPRLGTRKRR